MQNKKILVIVSILLLILSASAIDARRNAIKITDPVTLTPQIKDWLAVNAGTNNCFASTGIWYSDLEGKWRYGGTGSVMSMFYVAHMVGKEDVGITWGKTYTDMKALNNNVDFTINDVKWTLQNKYCYQPIN